MKRRYSLDWILVRLLIGAVIALASQSVRAQSSVTVVYNTTTGAQDNWEVQYTAGSVDPSLPDGSYSWAIRGELSGTPGSCSGLSSTVHPGFSKTGSSVVWSCADCNGGTYIMFNGNTTTSMPCFSGGTFTFTTLSAPTGGNSPTWVVTRQDQSTGGGGTVVATAELNVGGSSCTSPVTVTGHWTGGAPHAAGAVVNVVVGGFLVQVQCDANGCNSGQIPAASLNLTGSSPWSVDGGIQSGSWAICGVEGSRYNSTPTVTGIPSSIACGGTIDFAINANCTSSSPTPSPSASVAPSPSTTPVITPEPSPALTPLQYPTPPPNNPGTGVTNGGTTGSGISNQDIYNDVKQALDDAGTRDSHFGVPNGGFGFGNDPSGENGTAGNGLQSAVDRFTGDLHGGSDSLMGYVDSIDSLDLPTGFGDKKTWDVSLPVLGNITVDTTPYDTPVGILRALCLAILIVCAWFAMIRIIRSGVA